MNWRSSLKAVLIVTVVLALQGAGLVAAIPYHADHAAQSPMSGCSKAHDDAAPADTTGQQAGPCCDELGLCQPPSAAISGLTGQVLTVHEVVHVSIEQALAEHSSPPDPFPPRS